MSEWSDRTKQSLSRVYRAEGAPLQAWQWALVLGGVYLLLRASKSLGTLAEQIAKGINDSVAILLPSPDGLLIALEAADLELIKQKVPTTFSASQFAIMADNLESAFKSGLLQATEDEAAILREFSRLNTDRDFVRLFLAFGKRNFIIPGNDANLLAYINQFTDELKPEINAMFVSKGIKLRL